MNFCSVNGKVPDLKRHHPTQLTQRDELQQTLSNVRMCLFLPSFWPAIANDPSDYQ